MVNFINLYEKFIKNEITNLIDEPFAYEKEFDIQIPDDQAEKIATVGQAVQYIESSK